MSDAEFGDWEQDDASDTEPADPEQVAVRVHELRGFLSALSGEELAAWDALDDDEEEIAIALADRLIHFLTDDQVHAAEDFHGAVAFLSGQPEWNDLDTDVQQVATGLVDDILAWLKRQGAVA